MHIDILYKSCRLFGPVQDPEEPPQVQEAEAIAARGKDQEGRRTAALRKEKEDEARRRGHS